MPCVKGDVEVGSEETGVDITSDMRVKRSGAPIIKRDCLSKQWRSVAVDVCVEESRMG